MSFRCPGFGFDRCLRVVGGPVLAGALSCSAVLGLDEPTHRGSGGTQQTGGSANGRSGGDANGTTAGVGGDNSTIAAGGNQGGMGGAIGSGGGSQSGGAGGSGGAAGMPDGGSAGGPRDAGTDAPKAICATLPLCDDFEAAMVGARPDETRWRFDPTAPSNTAIVDGTPGKKTVRIEGVASPLSAGFENNLSLSIGQVWFIRMRVLIPKPLGNTAGGLMGILDETTGSHLWLGISGGYLGYFSIQAGAEARVLPSADANQLATGFKVPLTWICIEAKYDAQNAQVQTWVDGTDIAALRADGIATPGIDDVWMSMPPFKPKLTTVFFGWQGFYGTSVELWMDDVAVAATRIGCN